VKTHHKFVTQRIRLDSAVLCPSSVAACFLGENMPRCWCVLKTVISSLTSLILVSEDVND